MMFPTDMTREHIQAIIHEGMAADNVFGQMLLGSAMILVLGTLVRSAMMKTVFRGSLNRSVAEAMKL